MKSSNRKNPWLFNAWAVSVVATLGSLYLSEYLHFTPCSLCWFQRIFMYPLTILLGIASARDRIDIVPYAIPLAVVGGGFSAYHILLQEMPHDSFSSSCGPTSCMEDVLNAFGFLTVPMLALTAFAMIVFSLIRAKQTDNRDSFNRK
ncbi:disulfide oxidoreductase [Cohnella terricola]|uniref:Disulfide bond formation protein B n=1 Tax=Cohnella terricola TaxID=1289167 RepID=A0A559JQ54_9BACL|nr:disulfide oxidoreductase [Cohnella terricola]TVY01983.1 disulfide bond formation protein B [Cohnella terricola]